MDNILNDDLTLSSYDKYLLDCAKFNVSSTLTETEFINVKEKNFKFLPTNPVTMAMGIAALANKHRDRLLKAASTSGEALRNEGVKILLDEGINKVKSIKFNSGGGAGNKNSDVPSNGGDSVSESNRLMGIYTVKPIKAEFNPDILNRAYTSDVNLPTGQYSTTHLTGYCSQIPNDSATIFYFDNVLVPWLQQRAQSSVNFRIDLSRITADKVRTYLSNINDALNAYYFYASLISYVNLPQNKDQGLIALRKMISVDDLDYLNQLKQLLSSIPIPPNLNTLCFFMNQNFQDSEDGDGLLKFMPISFNTSTDANGTVTGFSGTDSAVLKNLITNLNSIDNRELASILVRIAPNWINPTIFDPSSVPIFSKTALTIFANCSKFYWWNGSNYSGNVVATKDTVVEYVSLDPNLDGAALALSSVILNLVGQYPSMARYVNSSTILSGTSYLCNRYSYVYSSSGDNYIWRPSNRQIESAFGRMERSRAYQNVEYYAKLPGSIRLSNLTSNTMNESAKDLLSWCMSIDTIKKTTSKNSKWSQRKSTTTDKVEEN